MSPVMRLRIALCFTMGVGFCLLATGSGWAQESEVSQVSWRRRVCPPESTPTYTSPAAPSATEAMPPQAAAPQPAMPSLNELAGDVGNAAGPMGVPNMIGDPARLVADSDCFRLVGLLPGVRSVGGWRRVVQDSENENPLPVDRVFFDYNHFRKP